MGSSRKNRAGSTASSAAVTQTGEAPAVAKAPPTNQAAFPRAGANDGESAGPDGAAAWEHDSGGDAIAIDTVAIGGDGSSQNLGCEDASPDADISDHGPEIDATEVPALAARVESLLFVSPRPMSVRRLAELVELRSVVPVRQACAYLNAAYEGRAFELRELAGGYQLLTRPAYEADVLKLQKQKKAQKLTPGALEVLAVIAYKQPVTRTELESIRGSGSDHHLRVLAERGLIRITGRRSESGQGGGAALYGTTTQFLNEFGLKSISELPTEDDLRDRGEEDAVPATAASTAAGDAADAGQETASATAALTPATPSEETAPKELAMPKRSSRKNAAAAQEPKPADTNAAPAAPARPGDSVPENMLDESFEHEAAERESKRARVSWRDEAADSDENTESGEEE